VRVRTEQLARLAGGGGCRAGRPSVVRQRPGESVCWEVASGPPGTEPPAICACGSCGREACNKEFCLS
jgi:hypothetical protein